VARAEVALAVARRDLHWLKVDYPQATMASAAAWRIHEEIDRLDAETKDQDELRSVAFVRGDATPGTPAQFRAQEEVDSLCDRIAGNS
jgi:hypothetical protein